MSDTTNLVLTETESKRLTDDYLSFAEDEHKAGNLSQSSYNKVMLQIAAEYLLEHFDEEASLRVLCKVDPDYIKDVLPIEMAEDQDLAYTMLKFTYHLERSGITWNGPVATNQPGGDA